MSGRGVELQASKKLQEFGYSILMRIVDIEDFCAQDLHVNQAHVCGFGFTRCSHESGTCMGSGPGYRIREHI